MTSDPILSRAVRACRNAAASRRWLASSLAAALLLSPTTLVSADLTSADTQEGPGEAIQRQIENLMAQNQVRPLSPPQKAPGIELPTVPGSGTQSLEDYEGRWVVLTFWATWCGYCKRSIPSLNQLHAQREKAGLSVLGVSVDAQKQPVAPFVRRHSMAFPTVWDANSQAAASYRARSIPTSFLVNPRGRVAGVVQGYRDWAELTPMLDQLMKWDPPVGIEAAVPATDAEAQGEEAALRTYEVPATAHPDLGNSRSTGPSSTSPGAATPSLGSPGSGGYRYASTSAPQAIPPQGLEPTVATDLLLAPNAEVSLSPLEPKPGETFYLTVRLRWSGEFDALRPSPPHVTLPSGITEGPMSASTSSEDGQNIVLYRLALEAPEAGNYDLGPVELRYTDLAASAAGEPVVEELAGPSLTVAAPAGPQLATPAALGATGAVVGLSAALWVRRRNARREALQAVSEDPCSQEIQAIRRLLLEGDQAGAARRLAELELDLGADGERASRLRRQIEAARYGGMSPPRQELESALRRIERKLHSSPQQQGRPQLRWRES